MKHITPIGEYEGTRRTMRFKCDAPWPLPGEVVIVVHAPDVAGSIVRVNDIGADGWIEGRMIGKARGKGLTNWIAMSGSI